MPLYSKDEIKAEIIALKAKISKAEDKQAYTSGGPGSGAHEQRGDLRAMYDRLAKLEAEWTRPDALDLGGNVGFVHFERPS